LSEVFSKRILQDKVVDKGCFTAHYSHRIHYGEKEYLLLLDHKWTP
jgi:hypothetical protein